jgi:hypothetical protein
MLCALFYSLLAPLIIATRRLPQGPNLKLMPALTSCTLSEEFVL